MSTFTLPAATEHNWRDKAQVVIDAMAAAITSAGTGTASIVIGTEVERAAYATPYNGLGWLASDANKIYKYSTDISDWVLVASQVSTTLVSFLASTSLANARTALDVPSNGEMSSAIQAASALILSAGISSGLSIKRKNVDEVTLGSGKVEMGGTLYDFTGGDFNATSVFGAALTTATWHQLYIDPSGAVDGALGLSDVFVQTTLPTWNTTKNGWYHPSTTTWRCPLELGWTVWANASSEIATFIVAGNVYNHAPLILLDDITPVTTATALATNVPGVGAWTILGEFRVGHATNTGVAGSVFNGLGSQVLWLFPNVASGGSLNSSVFTAVTDDSRQIMYSGAATTFATFRIFQTGFFLPPRP